MCLWKLESNTLGMLQLLVRVTQRTSNHNEGKKSKISTNSLSTVNISVYRCSIMTLRLHQETSIRLEPAL